MGFPPGIAAKTVTIGTAAFFDGSIAEGTVTITAPVNTLHVPSNRPLFSSQMSKRFVNGEATFDLVPTDHPELNRVDWTYKLVVVIPGALVQPEPISFLLPVAGPDIVDLDGLVTVPSSAGTPVAVDVLTTADVDPTVAGKIGDDTSQTSTALGNAIDSATHPLGVAARAAFGRVVTLADLPNPLYVPHSGGELIAPEHTREAYDYAMSVTNPGLIDIDVVRLSDGTLAIIHDQTVDAVTTGTGPVSSYSFASWKQLKVDAGNFLGGNWPNTLETLTLPDVLRAYGGRAVLSIENKVDDLIAAQAIVDMVVTMGLQKSVLFQSAFQSNLAPALAAGIECMLIGDDIDPAAVKAAGVNFVDMSMLATDSAIQAALAAGLTVGVYEVNRHVERDKYLALGVDRLVSGDPVYLRGGYRRTTDPFAGQTWYPGMINRLPGKRGVFTAPNKWGVPETANNGWVGVAQGWACPLPNPTDYTVTMSVDIKSWTAVGNYAALILGCATDRSWVGSGATVAGENGYRVLLAATGIMGIAKFTDGVAQAGGVTFDTPDLVVPLVLSAGLAAGVAITSLPVTALPAAVPAGTRFTLPGTAQTVTTSAAASAADTAIAIDSATPTKAIASGASLPQSVPLTIKVTPTQIIVTRADLTPANVATLTDSTYRGPYMHLGVVGTNTDWHGIAIS